MSSSGNRSVGSRGFSLADLPTHLPNASRVDVDANDVVEESLVSLEPVIEPIMESEPVTESISTRSNEIKQTSPNSNNIPSGSKKIYIQNTNISLDTEEDIQNWIAERRKNWPTRKNVEAKEEAKKTEVHNSKKRGLEDSNYNGKKQKRLCNFFAQNGRCKFGSKCKNLHEEKNDTSNNKPIDGTGGTLRQSKGSLVVRTINGVKVNIPQRFHSEFYGNTNASLSNMLLHKENMAEEGAKILDFIRYLDSQGMIDHDVSFSL